MERGYTLIELAVVILILGIVLMVAAPRLTPFLMETRLDSSARQLATFCRYTHAQAILTKTYLVLHIDIDAREYWVTAIIADAAAGLTQGNEEPEEIEITTDLLRRRRLTNTVSFQDVELSELGYADSGAVALDFTPVGARQEILVHLRGKRGSQVTVFFNPVTATSGILEGYVQSVMLRGFGSQ